MAKIPEENQDLDLEVGEEGEALYDGDSIWAVQESHLDLGDEELGCGPEIYIMSDRAYIIGAGQEETEYGEPGVEHSMATMLIMNLRMCQREWGDDEPLLIHLKTCGGMWDQGMAIHNAIKMYPAPVVVLNYAEARSMSSIIYCAADRRVMMPDGKFMFHTGYIQGSWTGRQFRTEYEEWEKSMTRMKEVYIERMQEEGSEGEFLTDAECDKWLEHKMYEKEDAYLDADESVSWGFTNYIFGGDWEELVQFDE
jgi:ATP-dependent protease ClpP protease subunit